MGMQITYRKKEHINDWSVGKLHEDRVKWTTIYKTEV